MTEPTKQQKRDRAERRRRLEEFWRWVIDEEPEVDVRVHGVVWRARGVTDIDDKYKDARGYSCEGWSLHAGKQGEWVLTGPEVSGNPVKFFGETPEHRIEELVQWRNQFICPGEGKA